MKRAVPLLLMTAIVLLLAACNFPGAAEEPTVGPEVIYTAAAQTLIAQETQLALGTPIAITSLTPGGVGNTPTSPVVVLPSNTPLPPTNTPIPTSTLIPPTPTATPIPCDRGQFDKDVTIPDNTEIAAGGTFQKTWRLKNNGSCTWTSNYALVFYSGDAMSGPPTAPITNGTVPPGSTVDITVTLTAPLTSGTYKGNWRLRNAGGVIFGIGPNADQSFWVQIKSVLPTPTPTVTPAYTLAFDFIAQGPNAHWRNATNNLPWGDQDSDAPGIAAPVSNGKMEDGNTYPNLLATYPQSIADGMILGLYPQYTIQTNDHLRTRIGFRYSCGNASARFQIKYIEGQTEVPVVDQVKNCDGTLASIDVNLANLVGHTVQFELIVLANGSSNGDITLWVAPHIER